MNLEQFAQVVAVTVGLATLGTVAWKLVARPIIRFLQRLEEFLEDWNGTPARPGSPRRPGAMERLQQLENNGGTSLKDVVDRTSAAVETLTNKVDAQHQDSRRLRAAVMRLEKHHPPTEDPPEESRPT